MAFINISVNVVAEYSGLCEEVAQEFLEQFDRINALLAWHGMPATIEPGYVLDFSPADEQRQYLTKFPVEYLRRLQTAYTDNCQGAFSASSEENVCPDSIHVSGELKTRLRYSHLNCHAGGEGIYIPNEAVLTPLKTSGSRPGLGVMGDVIGSSYGLLHELIELAPYIGIALEDDGSLPLHEAERLYQMSTLSKGELHQESCAWLALHEAAELSILYRTSIVMLPATV